MRGLISAAWTGMGADPELFLTQGGEVIGSEHVIPAEGLLLAFNKTPLVVRDGVQVELHTACPTACRQSFSGFLAQSMAHLQGHLIKHNTAAKDQPPVEVSWEPVVTVSEKEFAHLGDSVRLLGCAPSFSAYGSAALECPPDYRVRSAGGHLHLACQSLTGQIHADPQALVHLLDVIVGSTCVLLDRAERAAERRELYGRAGEFRLPKHGIEYRTLSNFWLRSRCLTSMVLAACRQVLTIWNDDRGAALLAKVDLGHVQETINTNNFEWALQTLEVVHDHQEKVLVPRRLARSIGAFDRANESWCFLPQDLAQFVHFAKRGPAAYWPDFANDLPILAPITGWETFRDATLATDFAWWNRKVKRAS